MNPSCDEPSAFIAKETSEYTIKCKVAGSSALNSRPRSWFTAARFCTTLIDRTSDAQQLTYGPSTRSRPRHSQAVNVVAVTCVRMFTVARMSGRLVASQVS